MENQHPIKINKSTNTDDFNTDEVATSTFMDTVLNKLKTMEDTLSKMIDKQEKVDDLYKDLHNQFGLIAQMQQKQSLLIHAYVYKKNEQTTQSTLTTALQPPPTINASPIKYGPADLREEEEYLLEPFDEMFMNMGDEESEYDEDEDDDAAIDKFLS